MALTEFWGIVTHAGDIRLWILVLFFSAVYIYIAKGHHFAFYTRHRQQFRKWLWVAFFALVIGGLASQGLKELLQVPRICDPLLNAYCPTDSFAFPSGHAAIAFAMLTAIPLSTGSRKHWLFLALAFVIAYSRLALGVHSFGDVGAGAILGVVAALAAQKIYDIEKYYKRNS